MTSSFAPSGDLSSSYQIAAGALVLLSLILLAIELRRSRSARISVFVSGVFAALALLCAVLRPVTIQGKGTFVGPRVVVLVDGSRSIDLPISSGKTRRDEAIRALSELDKRGTEVRLSTFAFGKGAPIPLGAPTNAQVADSSTPPAGRLEAALRTARPMPHSDLVGAIEAVSRAADERPAAIVIVSDGRLDRPGEVGPGETIRASLGTLDVPLHTVALATEAPADASVRAVRAAGAAVAHQPLSLRVDIGCTGSLDCSSIPVSLRELREAGEPTALASGKANASTGLATLEFDVTLDRAGVRIIEVSVQAPSGDVVADNDTRYIAIDVARDRVRVLHVAGRPTYDVRALRMWLKSDASVDVVAFFILRDTVSDDLSVPNEELALIPFPVDELFNQHLPSFDAVVLQDFNALPYGLSVHLKSLTKYVDKGGGLIMVGGPEAFVPGNYAATPLASALPVALDGKPKAEGVDVSSFVPRLTEAGRVAPVLAPLQELIGEEWPEMPGANVVGDVRSGATVLLEHPTRKTPTGAPMPLLALGEYGSGRTIALAIDGSHRLLFSAFAANAAGRAHGAFWDGLLGWLMRDPRFEPAVVELPDGCVVGEATTLTLRPLPGQTGEAKIIIRKLGNLDVVRTLSAELDGHGELVELPAGKLEAGGYSATVEITPKGETGDGVAKGPTTRRDFACERGGDEWADSRPDPDRLYAIAAATGGKGVTVDDISKVPLPAATQIAMERRVSPIMPAWGWTFAAALLCGAHWVIRRRGGLA